MVALLSRMRKEMNGAVADAMFCYGKPYGLNYGVSLPTIRMIARQIEPNNDLAQYLFKQQVRELQLAAMHIAQSDQLTLEEIETWGDGIVNSEIAEEMAFTILRHHPQIREIFQSWGMSENEFKVYAALLAAAKSNSGTLKSCLDSITRIIVSFPSSRPIAQGVVALLDSAYAQQELKAPVKELLANLEDSPASDYIREEMEWRMDY